jgi:hypothetical protein
MRDEVEILVQTVEEVAEEFLRVKLVVVVELGVECAENVLWEERQG